MIDIETYRARIGSFHAHSHGNSGTSGTRDETRDRKYLNSLKLSFQLRKQIVKKTEKVIYPTIPRTKNSQHANETNRREKQNTFYFVFLYSKLCNLLKVLLKYKFQALFSLLVVFVISMLLLRAGVEPNPGPDEIGYNEMDTVCRMIGDNWKRLTRRLFHYQDVSLGQNIILDCDRESNVYDKCFEMLLKWREQCQEPTKQNLFQALQDLKLTWIVDHFKSYGLTEKQTEDDQLSISGPPNKVLKLATTNDKDSYNHPSTSHFELTESLPTCIPVSQGQISSESTNTGTSAQTPTDATEGGRLGDTLSKVQAELKCHYRRTTSKLNPIPGIITDPPNIRYVYTNLTILGKTREKVSLQAVLTLEGDPECVLVEGAPGIGKSTLCRKVVYDWAEPSKKEYWVHDFYLVFLIEVRQLKGSIIDAIFQQLLPEDMIETKNELQTYILQNQNKILFVVDGYDELGENIDSDLKKLMEKRIYSQCFVIVTSRPTRIREIQSHFDKHLVNKGYTMKLAKSYIQKYFESMGKPVEYYSDLLMKIKENPNVRDLIRNPLNVVLLCILWEDNTQAMPDTVTELYYDLSNTILRRYCSKKGIEVSYAPNIVFPEWLTEYFNNVQKIAFEAVCEDTLSFEENHKLIRNLDPRALDIGFLNKELSSARIKRCDSYTFPHKTFQEFLAARHILNQQEKWQSDFLGKNTKYLKQLEKFSMMYQFLTGLSVMWADGDALSYFKTSRLLFQNYAKCMSRKTILNKNSCIDAGLLFPRTVTESFKESKYNVALAKILSQSLPLKISLEDKLANCQLFEVLVRVLEQCEDLKGYSFHLWCSTDSTSDKLKLLEWRKFQDSLLPKSVKHTLISTLPRSQSAIHVSILGKDRILEVDDPMQLYFNSVGITEICFKHLINSTVVIDEHLSNLEKCCEKSNRRGWSFQCLSKSPDSFSLLLSASCWSYIRENHLDEDKYCFKDVTITPGAISYSLHLNKEDKGHRETAAYSSRIEVRKLCIHDDYDSAVNAFYVKTVEDNVFDISVSYGDWNIVKKYISTDHMNELALSYVPVHLQEILKEINIGNLNDFSLKTSSVSKLQFVCDNQILYANLKALSFKLDSLDDLAFIAKIPSLGSNLKGLDFSFSAENVDSIRQSHFETFIRLFKDMCNIERLSLQVDAVYVDIDLTSCWARLFDSIRHLHLSAKSCNVPNRKCDLHSEEATSHGLKYLEIERLDQFSEEDLCNLIDCITSSSLKECHLTHWHRIFDFKSSTLCLSRSNCNTPLCSETGLEMKVIDLNALEDEDLQAALLILARGDDITRIKRHLRTILEGDSVEWTLRYHIIWK